ncbi:hypothetical protein HMPREF3199_00118 [Enterococcus faecium]|nr:hypothetical protein HMPREF1345_01128 [Enterococcus faecium TX1337RF]KXA12334.1 hypothetical protein HMPREF3199_00118 [Enterococcus faecium]
MNTTTKAYNFKSFLEKGRYLLDSWSFFYFLFTKQSLCFTISLTKKKY